MSFDALEVSYPLVRSLREVLPGIRQRDRDLAEQLMRSASSVALNVSEAIRREGRDRRHLFRVAAGSANESLAALRVAEAWGHVATERLRGPLELLDRILAMLWRLTH